VEILLNYFVLFRAAGGEMLVWVRVCLRQNNAAVHPQLLRLEADILNARTLSYQSN
jgi:hypothetical protein